MPINLQREQRALVVGSACAGRASVAELTYHKRQGMYQSCAAVRVHASVLFLHYFYRESQGLSCQYYSMWLHICVVSMLVFINEIDIYF